MNKNIPFNWSESGYTTWNLIGEDGTISFDIKTTSIKITSKSGKRYIHIFPDKMVTRYNNITHTHRFFPPSVVSDD